MGFEAINSKINSRIHNISKKIGDNSICKLELNELAELIYPMLNYYISTFCKNKLDTEDTVQWTMKKIFKNLSKYSQSKGRFTTWIYRIARNEALYFIWAKKRNTHIPLDFCNLKTGKTYSSLIPLKYRVNGTVNANIKFTTKEVEINELYKKTCFEILSLDDATLRKIAICKMIENKKIKEIAIEFAMNENTVKTKLRKIKKRS